MGALSLQYTGLKRSFHNLIVRIYRTTGTVPAKGAEIVLNTGADINDIVAERPAGCRDYLWSDARER